MCIYAFLTGDGRANSVSITSSSIFASLWQVDGIFLYYYSIAHKEDSKSVYIISLLLLIYKLICGFTGYVFTLVIFELQFRRKRKINGFKMPIYILASYIVGGELYSLLFPLKFAIRYGTEFDWSKRLSFTEGLNKLCERFSHLNTTLYTRSNLIRLIKRYTIQKIDMIETRAFFRPLIPSFLYKNKVFSNIGNTVHNDMTGYTRINGTDSPDILTYIQFLVKSDFMDFIGWFFLLVISLLIIRYICCCFQTYKGQFDMLYFWIIVNGLSICGTLETLFSNTYLKIIFFIPLLWVLGVIKIYKKESSINENITDCSAGT
jgi:hypothetical protein